jgi:hypothetical protein
MKKGLKKHLDLKEGDFVLYNDRQIVEIVKSSVTGELCLKDIKPLSEVNRPLTKLNYSKN